MKSQLISIDNIFYYNNSYIIPFEIMISIEEYLFKGNKISIKPDMIFSRDNNIYLIDNIKIIFGNINEQFLFSPEYIFSYNSLDNFNIEKELIYSIPITKYIKQRKCQINNSESQNLKDNNKPSKILGQFITLNNNSKIKINSYGITDNEIINKKKEIKVNTIKDNSFDNGNIRNIKNIDGNRELDSNYKKKRPNLNMIYANNYNNSIENSNEEDE